MTLRAERDQRRLERKVAVMGRLARRAMTNKATGLDGLAKRALAKRMPNPDDIDPDLEHPADWDRPID